MLRKCNKKFTKWPDKSVDALEKFSNWKKVFGVRMGVWGPRWYQSKCRSHSPIPLLHTSWAYIAKFSHIIQRGRQTDGAIGMAWLCISIIDPKVVYARMSESCEWMNGCITAISAANGHWRSAPTRCSNEVMWAVYGHIQDQVIHELARTIPK